MLDVLEQGRRHFFRRQVDVHDAGLQRAFGHAIELGRLRRLHHDQAADIVNIADAARAIAARAGQDDADGPIALVLGQRAEKVVDG